MESSSAPAAPPMVRLCRPALMHSSASYLPARVPWVDFSCALERVSGPSNGCSAAGCAPDVGSLCRQRRPRYELACIIHRVLNFFLPSADLALACDSLRAGGGASSMHAELAAKKLTPTTAGAGAGAGQRKSIGESALLAVPLSSVDSPALMVLCACVPCVSRRCAGPPVADPEGHQAQIRTQSFVFCAARLLSFVLNIVVLCRSPHSVRRCLRRRPSPLCPTSRSSTSPTRA